MKSETTLKSGGHTCPWWLLFTFDNPIRKLVHQPEKVLAPYVKPGDTVLDVGCGMGYFTLGLAQLVGAEGQVIAADLQTQMLAGLQKRGERVGLLDRIQLCQSTPDRIWRRSTGGLCPGFLDGTRSSPAGALFAPDL
jgi:SAM-dependent methyltransferase